MEIVKKSLITLWASLMMISVLILVISGGTKTLNLNELINTFKINNENYNFYYKVIKMIEGNNYSNLSQFNKNFWLTSKVMSLNNLVTNIADIPFIGWFLKGFINMIVLSLSLISIVIDFILQIFTFGVVIIVTMFEMMPTIAV